MKSISKNNAGFTLIELTIVIVIVGILMSSFLSAYTLYMQRQKITVTQENINNVNDAIAGFQQQHGYLPCPAVPSEPVPISGATGTQSDCSTNMVDGVDSETGMASNVTGSGLQRVRVGVVPVSVHMPDGSVKQLLPIEQTVDGWRNRLTYAVIETMAVPGGMYADEEGSIIVQDRAGNNMSSTAKYVVLSHGPDGSGAYTTTGALRNPCHVVVNDEDASQDDENCNGDARFISLNQNESRSATDDVNNFDDFVLGDAQPVQDIKCPSGTEMRGFNLRARTPVCASRDLNCSSGAFTGVNIAEDGTISPSCRTFSSACPPGQVMVQIEEGGAELLPSCVKSVQGSCPVGFVQIGTEDFMDSDNDGKDDESGRPVAFGKEKCAKIVKSCGPQEVQVGMGGPTGTEPMCAKRAAFDKCKGNQVLVGLNADGSSNCVNAPKCTKGHYMVGLVDGVPACSKSVEDKACPKGQFVKSITKGIPICGSLAENGPIEIGVEQVETVCPAGTGIDIGKERGGSSYFTCVAYCPKGKRPISGSCWMGEGHAISSSGVWERGNLSGWECSSASDYASQTDVIVRAICAGVR